jgi:hypothetical protein
MTWDIQLTVLLYSMAIILSAIMIGHVYRIWQIDKTINLAKTILFMASSWIVIAASVIILYFMRHTIGGDNQLTVFTSLSTKVVFLSMVLYTYYDLIIRKR